jgi:enoyl-CoA hydratase
MTVSDLVLVEVADAVATVTLNRPDARNALNRELRKALPTALLELDARDDVAAIVLTGADPAFCAGLDLKELASGGDALRETGAAGGSGATGAGRRQRGPFPEMATPVIGAINGVAITGGFEVALACDYLVASERARFADTHARVGIMPGGGITVLLARHVGLPRAIEMSLTGNFVAADEALRIGLVNHVVPHEELLTFARGLAADIVSNDQTGVRRLLGHYRRSANAATLDEAHLIEGYMAEQWTRDASALAVRRESVTARGRQQSR